MQLERFARSSCARLNDVRLWNSVESSRRASADVSKALTDFSPISRQFRAAIDAPAR